MSRRRAIVSLFLALVLPQRVAADAIVRSQAMLSSTIAEYAIEDDGVVVDLEIGVGDLAAFANLVPDELYERLGNAPRPLAERLADFFARDFVIIADDRALTGRILEAGPATRVRRDDITGEPLPPLPGTEEETVVRVRLAYPLDRRPATVTIGGAIATRASIGFVVYHQGVAVNDFRYLGPEATLELDWDDPWYTAFTVRTLRRAYFAPMTGFLYVEPYEVRKEIIVRPKTLQEFVDLGLAGRDTIPVDIQDELTRTAAEFLRAHHRVEIDGQAIEPQLARINFLERTLKASRVIEPPEELDLNVALLGAIFVYDTDGLPQRVTMDWDLFNDRVQMIPVASVDQAGPLPTFLEPDYAVLEWQNFLKNPELPTLVALTAPPSAIVQLLGALRWPLLALAVGLIAWAIARRQRARGIAAPVVVSAALGALAAVAFTHGRAARATDETMHPLIAGLLHNVYRAFDHRGEEQIYDTLAASVDGELLTTIYLETRRGLELANQGGARAKVKAIELTELAVESSSAERVRTRASWDVRASVGHWGHVHQRHNRYRAALDVAPVDGAWKLVAIEILEEERL